jgi:hypothetical protein
MKALVLGLVMLASTAVRSRGSAVDEAARRLPEGDARTMAALMSVGARTPPADSGVVEGARSTDTPFAGPAEADGSRRDEGEQISDQPAEQGDWEVACQLKSGSALMFDRGSLRTLGAATLVRWAAPTDPRAEGQVYAALVDCREKSIEAAWPGKRSETRAGTCGRRLVDAVCELAPRRARAGTGSGPGASK